MPDSEYHITPWWEEPLTDRSHIQPAKPVMPEAASKEKQKTEIPTSKILTPPRILVPQRTLLRQPAISTGVSWFAYAGAGASAVALALVMVMGSQAQLPRVQTAVISSMFAAAGETIDAAALSGWVYDTVQGWVCTLRPCVAPPSLSGQGSVATDSFDTAPIEPFQIGTTTASDRALQVVTVYERPQQIIQQPVTERVIERVVKEVPVKQTVYVNTGTTQEVDTSVFTSALQLLDEKLSRQITAVSQSIPAQQTFSGGGAAAPSYNNTFGLSQKIDTLTNTQINNPTISGGTISGATIDSGSLSGVVTVAKGGTGTTTAPSYGQVLLGNSTGGYDLVSTSSLGITGGGGTLTDIGPLGQLQTGPSVTLASSTTGTDFTITASGNTITFNIPTASSANRGLLSTSDWSLFNNKVSPTSIDTSSELASLVTDETGSGALVFDTNATLSSTTLSTNTLLTNATTTTFAITSLTSTLLKTTSNGTLTAAVAGTDYANFSYLFPSNATSTLLAFNGGLTSYASTTIGSGTQAGGLTISGGATTTGNAYVAGLLGIGTTTPALKLNVYGGGTYNGLTSTLLLENSIPGVTFWDTNDGASAAITSNGGVLSFYANETGAFAGADLKMTISTTSNVGIGTSTPFRKLSLTDAVSTAQTAIAYDTTRYTDLLTDSVGDFTINPQGDDVRLNDDNMWVCAGGSCPTGTPSGNGNLIVESNIGIGTSTPAWSLDVYNASAPVIQLSEGDVANSNAFIGIDGGSLFTRRGSIGAADATTLTSSGSFGIGTTSPTQQLSVQNLLYVGANGATGMGTATSTFQGDIKITGKLDVGTIDPVYTIGGVKYATYGASTIGVKEEVATKVSVTSFDDERNLYAHTIRFDEQDKGSDMWLFYQITHFGDAWKDLVVSLTPAFEGNIFYEENPTKNTLTIFASQPGNVSIRLIAPRYDAAKWPNLRDDQYDPFTHHTLNEK